ncbi:hypothetical protein [Roseicyclus marinus]|uniref:hypothetical protein n=1 Tax=Roseicyclus marinus TaxID=2161673 RepID=UPI00240F4E94|nr:hypothetical protein [Roseicyclus marinus]MDG3039776.1 hypothetical protein [Roseicyclus marinus]
MAQSYPWREKHPARPAKNFANLNLCHIGDSFCLIWQYEFPLKPDRPRTTHITATRRIGIRRLADHNLLVCLFFLAASRQVPHNRQAARGPARRPAPVADHAHRASKRHRSPDQIANRHAPVRRECGMNHGWRICDQDLSDRKNPCVNAHLDVILKKITARHPKDSRGRTVHLSYKLDFFRSDVN